VIAHKGLAHLPLILARRQTYNSTKLRKVPQRTRAEGGQVEPVLARTLAVNDVYGYN
jgi:hypothetical protein